MGESQEQAGGIEAKGDLAPARPLRGWRSISALLAVLAFAGLVGLHLRDLWAEPATRYLTLAVPALALCLWRRWPELAGTPGVGTRGLARLLFYGGLFLLGAAAALFSPWLASLAALLSFSGWLLVHGGLRPITRLLPIWIMVGLLALPPAGVLPAVHHILQSSNRMATRLLDVAFVEHLPRGSMFVLPESRLFVADWGLDERYLLPLLVFAAAYAVLRRQNVLVGVLLLAAVAVWYWLVNAVSMVTVVGLDLHTGADGSGNLMPLLLRSTLLLAIILLAACSEQLLSFFLDPIPPPQADLEADEEGFDDDPVQVLNPLAQAWNYVFARPPRGAASAERGQPTASFNYRAVAAASILLLTLQGVCFWLFREARHVEAAANRLREIEAEALPAQLGRWTRTEFASGAAGDSSGHFHTAWTYASGAQTATVTVQYPGSAIGQARALHPPAWSILQHRRRADSDRPDDERFVEAEFARQSGEYGYLAYSVWDDSDAATGWPTDQGHHRSAFLVRLFVASNSILLDDDLKELRALFHDVRGSLRQHWAALPAEREELP